MPSPGRAISAGHGHVGGREAELGAAPAVAVRPPCPGPGGAGRAARPRPATSPAASSCADAGGGDRRSPASSGQADARRRRSPGGRPSRASSATLPLRPCPKWKSSPTTTRRAPRAPTRTSATKSSAVSLARASSKGTTSVRSTPAVGQQLELLVEVGEERGGRLGPDHRGRVAVEGDHHGLPARARRPVAAARPSRWRWPRWTPS